MGSTVETMPTTKNDLRVIEDTLEPDLPEATPSAESPRRSARSQRRHVLSTLLGDAALASRRYVTSYSVGSGAE